MHKNAMNSKYFGKLKYDEELNWYTCKLTYLGAQIRLSICAENSSINVSSAENTIKLLLSRDYEIQNHIEREYYQLYKKNWAPFLFGPSRAGFRKKLEPNGIVIYVTGDLDVYFNDGGLFKGHDVVVRFSEQRGFHNVRLSG